MEWLIDTSTMKELEEALRQAGKTETLEDLMVKRRRWRGASPSLLWETENALTDVVQAMRKGDRRALKQAIEGTEALLAERGWRICGTCGSVWWIRDQDRGKDDGCPNCPKEWSMTFDGFNPEGMDKDELQAFSRLTAKLYPVAEAQRFFGGPPYRPGYVKVFKKLMEYARNKSAAMGLREKGQIVKAKRYERVCQEIYEDLPAWARW